MRLGGATLLVATPNGLLLSTVMGFELLHRRVVGYTLKEKVYICRAYTPGTHARKDEDGLLLKFPCNPTRTRSV
jgi:hypothetical protein